MKKWLKSEVCRSVNSAQVHCSRKTWSTTAAGKKKKKKLKTCYNAKRGRGLVSKPTLCWCLDYI